MKITLFVEKVPTPLSLQTLFFTKILKIKSAKSVVFHNLGYYAEQLRCSAYWVCFDDRTIWVFCDFFTPKRFKPRPSFFSMSKYRNSRRDSKNFKFFPPQVFQIFDSKHGSPENYSDFFFFLFFLLPDRGLCVLRGITPQEDVEQSERNFADVLRGKCSCT